MSYYSYIFIGFAVLFQELFYFAGSVSYVCSCLLHVFFMHEFSNFIDLFMVVFTLDFLYKIKIFLLILKGIIFDVPKLSFSLYL